MATLVVLTLCSGAAHAVPTQVPYVGYLENSLGVPFQGTVIVKAALYDTPTPNVTIDQALWGPHEFGGLPVHAGVLAFVLGGAGSPPVSGETMGEGPVWLSIWVNGTLLTPGQQVLSVPYALLARDANMLGGQPATEYATLDDLNALDALSAGEAGAAFAPKATEAGLAALQQTVSLLSSRLDSAETEIAALQSCCEASANPCAQATNGTPCNDGNACTTQDACAAGICAGTPLSCSDNNTCTTDSCNSASGACVHTPVANCCGNGVQEGGETCDDGNQAGGDSCPANCQGGNLGVSVPGFSGSLGPDLSAQGFAQCGSLTQLNPNGMGSNFYALCNGYQYIRFACSTDNNNTAEYVSPPFLLAGNSLTDAVCDDWVGASNSIYGGDFILSVDASDPGCNQFNVSYQMYIHFGTQWGCAGVANTHSSGGRMWAYVSQGPLNFCALSPNGASCDDGNPCTVQDQCSAGACVGTPKNCSDGNTCTTDTCGAGGACAHAPIANCCGNGSVESGEICDDGNQQNGDSCPANCNTAPVPQAVPGFSGAAGPDFSGDGFMQCGGLSNGGGMGASFYSLCGGYSEIRFACSRDNNTSAEYISPVFSLAGKNLTDGVCDDWDGAANSIYGSDFILSVDDTNPNCNQFNVSYDMYVHFGTQWGCAGFINTHSTGGRMWAYVR
jgi:cysteine-rich repeat protein